MSCERPAGRFFVFKKEVVRPLASLWEGGGPAGLEGESLAAARSISGRDKVLSPTACGRSPLPEGAKELHYILHYII